MNWLQLIHVSYKPSASTWYFFNIYLRSLAFGLLLSQKDRPLILHEKNLSILSGLSRNWRLP